MSKTLWVTVAIVVNTALLLLSAVVPGQFQKTFKSGNRVVLIFLRSGVGSRISQEVQVETSVLVLGGTEVLHAEHLLVVLQACLSILDPNHSVVQAVG